MSHTHNHPEGLHCSCCNPMWKSLLPNIELEEGKNNEDAEHSETLIFRTGSNPAEKDDKRVGYIQTMAGGKDVMVEAVGIQDGHIIVTGSHEYVKANMPVDTTEQIIYGRQTLLPGFIEPHIHILPSAVFNMATDVGPFIGQYLRTNIALTEEKKYSKNWVIRTLRDLSLAESASKKEKETTWIFGRNVDPSLLIDESKEFNAEVLDKISDVQPVFLMNSSVHLAYVNTAAIKLAKNENIILPASGVLKEIAEMQLVLPLIIKSIDPIALKKRLSTEVDTIFTEASQRGVTYVFDAAVEPFSKDSPLNQPDYLEAKANNDCPVRIGGALVAVTLNDFNSKIEGRYHPNQGDDKFNLAYIKVISDGSNQGMTGYQYTPYDCDENYNLYGSDNAKNIAEQTNEGIFNYGYPLEFDTMISKAVDNDWPIMVHANGDHALDRTIKAFKLSGINKSTIEARRDRIEHASLLSDQNMTDMQKLGISPSFLIGHVGYWGWVFQQTILGQERSNHLDRCHSAIHDYNMRITLHSDYSVTPLGPLRMMEQSITRIMEGAPKELNIQVLNKAERITRFQALKAMTYDAAWQCHANQWVGSLEVGKCADFVLLEENPLTYSCEEGVYSAKGMRNIPVLETWKGGIKRYSTADEIKALLLQNPSLRARTKEGVI
ncbi:amidohydrolase [Tenacibaculum sp. Bg11-29]|uniref:amidohydrolase n=1 Tax=Tenacibaculum sp. Bg11-29 TaxID=2058306 RepID=UPI000C349426|nr:amidohydrolase family protein [Tenacibaculum sp. Bg11-29]PKH52528.1 amidohydrolase [Tenacibaculum sp. Bg11-29]